MAQTIADLGEQGLLTLLHSFCPADAVGDDAALLQLPPQQSLVVTTDVLVDGVHFSDRTTPPHSVGWRGAAANLSDLAAMGATGIGITVGLSIPPSCPVSWLEAVYQGLKDCLSAYGCSIVGGDVCRSPVRSLAITAFGSVRPEHQIRRNTARAGDVLVVTGNHGGSRAGLDILMGHQISNLSAGCSASEFNSDPARNANLIHKHRYPEPRLDCVPLLNSLSSATVISGMDSSDGLADAVIQICRASNVGAILWADHVPMPSEVLDRVSPETATDWALYGGEDFELVLAMPQRQADVFCRAITSAHQIGEVRSNVQGVELWETKQQEQQEKGGKQSPIRLDLKSAFQHFP